MKYTASPDLITLAALGFASIVSGFFVPHGRDLRCSHKLFVATRPGKIGRDANAPKPSVAPYFKIKDWEAALPIMQEFDDLAEMLEIPAFGWSMSGDNMVFRAHLNDENELADFYVDSLSSLIDRMLETAAAIDHVEIAGLSERSPSSVEDRSYSTKRYKLEDGFFSKLGSDEELSLDAKRTLVRAKPYLTIINEKEARPLMAQIVETAHQEEGCLFYGWHMEENKVICDGAYRDSSAFSEHYKKVAPIMEQLLNEHATIDKFEVHASKQELEKTRKTTTQGIFSEIEVQEFSTNPDSWNGKK